jgi:hypothetical protein
MPSATLAQEAPPIETGDLFKKAVLLVLTFCYGFGIKRRVKDDAVQTEAEDGWVEGYKKTLKSAEFEAIKSADGKLMAYIKTRCLPSLDKLLKSGIYPLPLELVSEVDEAIEHHKVKRMGLVEGFLDVYETRCEEAKEALGDLWSQRDYPSTDELRESLDLRTQYIAIDAPAALKGISQSLFQRERNKTESMWSELREESKKALRGQALEFVNYALDRLVPSVDGKKKVFRESTLEKFDDFVNTFSARNIANDSELATVIADIKEVMNGVGIDDLKKDGTIRQVITEKFTEAKNQMGKLMIEEPTRRFSLEEE